MRNVKQMWRNAKERLAANDAPSLPDGWYRKKCMPIRQMMMNSFAFCGRTQGNVWKWEGSSAELSGGTQRNLRGTRRNVWHGEAHVPQCLAEREGTFSERDGTYAFGYLFVFCVEERKGTYD